MSGFEHRGLRPGLNMELPVRSVSGDSRQPTSLRTGLLVLGVVGGDQRDPSWRLTSADWMDPLSIITATSSVEALISEIT